MQSIESIESGTGFKIEENFGTETRDLFLEKFAYKDDEYFTIHNIQMAWIVKSIIQY